MVQFAKWNRHDHGRYMFTPIFSDFPGAFHLLILGVSLVGIALYGRMKVLKRSPCFTEDKLMSEISMRWPPEEKVTSYQEPDKKAA